MECEAAINQKSDTEPTPLVDMVTAPDLICSAVAAQFRRPAPSIDGVAFAMISGRHDGSASGGNVINQIDDFPNAVVQSSGLGP